LIAKGRLLAPDATMLKEFQFKAEDYIHAVVAPVGVRGGQQAVMAQTDVGTSGSGTSSSTTMSRRALRSVGVGPTGLILARRQPGGDSDTDSSGEDETGATTTNTGSAGDVEAGTVRRSSRNSRRTRERRGFDRLRNGTAPGLTTVRLERDEIAAIRLYFRPSVDQFAERRRRRQRRQRRRTAATEASSTATADSDSIRVTGSSTTNDDNNTNNTAGTTVLAESGISNNNGGSSTTVEIGGETSPPSPVTNEAQRRLERFVIEEEWMTAQGPMSEFRMNLRTTTANAATLLSHRTRIGLGGPSSIFDTGSIRGGADAARAARGGGNNTNPLASSSIGTDREFMWGFFMGFFVGFVMLFWVWLPTVSQKQKIGILTGISCQMGFSMLHQRATDSTDGSKATDNGVDGLVDNTTTSSFNDIGKVSGNLSETAANSSLVSP
jgi:hypothetical protein